MAPRAVFVDTSGWFSLINRRDPRHGETAALARRLITGGSRLVSTDYVVDESYTLAKVRSGSLMAMNLLDLVSETAALDLEWIGPERFETARAYFRKHADQAFSFTDCTSFIVMRERRISGAITTDEHFRIAGFEILQS